jgi:hypothetical protein
MPDGVNKKAVNCLKQKSRVQHADEIVSAVQDIGMRYFAGGQG